MKRTKKKSPRVFKKKFEYILEYQRNDGPVVESFDSLSEVRSVGLKKNLSLDTTYVYRFDPVTKKQIKLSKTKYLYLNKLYNASKSIDGTGFYYEWSWDKKGPFKQPAMPLPESFTKQSPLVVVETAMPAKLVKKTFWQKVKQYILNMFE